MFTDDNNIFEEVFLDETNFMANAANFAALIYHNFKDINWAGFYLVDNDELILGPFQGKIACVRIKFGHGVCGTAAKLKKTVIVNDVHEFPGHIACDANSRSEIVIPIIKNDILYGVLDIDSPILNRFNIKDGEMFEKYLKNLIGASDMDALRNYYKIDN